jgi:lipid-A-disaccharide synthase
MNAPAFAADAFRPVRDGELNVFLVAGEPSGDALGANLMRGLAARAGRVRFAGVGGPAMEAEGLTSLLPLSELSVMGILPVLRRLPQLIACIRKTADAAIAARADLLVIIDSPDFTHRVARRARRARPTLPIVNYAGPSVWAWRPGRARRMRAYVDHVMALLPFEPAAYARLGGPDCTYVGHPLLDAVASALPNAEELRARHGSPATLLVMPGSREAEIRRLMPVFGSALALLNEAQRSDIVLPTLAHLETAVRAETEKWPLKPRIITDAVSKYAAMRRARAALVASGTATLELALAEIPMVVAYRVSRIDAVVARAMLKIDWIALPNLILDRRAVPELLQGDCVPQSLAAELRPLLAGGMQRDAQLAGFAEVALVMGGGHLPHAGNRAAELAQRIACRRRLAERAHR